MKCQKPRRGGVRPRWCPLFCFCCCLSVSLTPNTTQHDRIPLQTFSYLRFFLHLRCAMASSLACPRSRRALRHFREKGPRISAAGPAREPREPAQTTSVTRSGWTTSDEGQRSRIRSSLARQRWPQQRGFQKASDIKVRRSRPSASSSLSSTTVEQHDNTTPPPPQLQSWVIHLSSEILFQ